MLLLEELDPVVLTFPVVPADCLIEAIKSSTNKILVIVASISLGLSSKFEENPSVGCAKVVKRTTCPLGKLLLTNLTRYVGNIPCPCITTIESLFSAP